MLDQFDHLYKVIVIGDICVGKTSLLLRYVSDCFNQEEKSTIGVQFYTTKISTKNETFKIQLWDTAGQERFHSINKFYYRGIHGAIICFDLTNQKTLDNVLKWHTELIQNADENVKILLIGTKSDLTDHRVVGFDTAQQVAKQIGAGYIETSARTTHNVAQAFKLLTQYIHSEQQQLIIQENHSISNLKKDNILILENSTRNTQGTTRASNKCC